MEPATHMDFIIAAYAAAVIVIAGLCAWVVLDYRAQHGAFHAVDELDAIPGIGPARLADLKGLVVP